MKNPSTSFKNLVEIESLEEKKTEFKNPASGLLKKK